MIDLAHQHPLTTVMLINVALLGIGYRFVYPPVAGQMGKLALRSLVIDASAIGLAALLFMGEGIPFLLFGFDLTWLGFAFASLVLLELPLFIAFGLRNGWDQRSGQP